MSEMLHLFDKNVDCIMLKDSTCLSKHAPSELRGTYSSLLADVALLSCEQLLGT